MLAYLFRDLTLHRIMTNCDTRSAASGALLRRVGRVWRVDSDPVWENGEWITEGWHALLRREWGAKN